MGLWIAWYEGPDRHIEAAVERSLAVLTEAGFTPEEAQNAAMEAADLNSDFDEATPNSDQVVAWFQAEMAGMEILNELDGGTWPNGVALIYVQQGD
ncbi:hypothetical protein J7369_22105 [Xanthomonas phaseoli pv. dieffenbachiae]|uniref:hypothetical protein n=1 Tax=Xanthomonas TaxID=338 RepID=UPI001ADD09E8|nr:MULTISPECIES: hypothetical protein [Xanthomonas]MBO9900317.1 hypothetical protein [Xanthomonas phaseoli pv. dieffenbachiae]MCC8612807.1 hypothetical protein [Xanthomonas euvesicatoria pv. euvesicatoria]CAD7740345.1 hypothetical protein LMG31884_46550 [Xanthomonas hydrangeae]CAD7740349.1 hypothetical protein LMG31884_46550 [Xanthomonas hydrangeae]